jgi:hypothetical protein
MMIFETRQHLLDIRPEIGNEDLRRESLQEDIAIAVVSVLVAVIGTAAMLIVTWWLCR